MVKEETKENEETAKNTAADDVNDEIKDDAAEVSEGKKEENEGEIAESKEVKSEEIKDESKKTAKQEPNEVVKEENPDSVKEEKEEPKEEKEEPKEEKKEITKVFGEEVKAGQAEDDEDTVDEGDAPPTLFKQDLVKNTEENDSESRSCPPDLEVIEPSSFVPGGGSGLQWPKVRHHSNQTCVLCR